jgi:hypothetical protein
LFLGINYWSGVCVICQSMELDCQTDRTHPGRSITISPSLSAAEMTSTLRGASKYEDSTARRDLHTSQMGQSEYDIRGDSGSVLGAMRPGKNPIRIPVINPNYTIFSALEEEARIQGFTLEIRADVRHSGRLSCRLHLSRYHKQ